MSKCQAPSPLISVLIDWLINKAKLLPEDFEKKKWDWAEGIFLDKNGDPFKKNALAQALQNYEERFSDQDTPDIKKLDPLKKKLSEL